MIGLLILWRWPFRTIITLTSLVWTIAYFCP